MRFGKYLDETSVPAWRSEFISYKRLKKLIKKIEPLHVGPPSASWLHAVSRHDPHRASVSESGSSHHAPRSAHHGKNSHFYIRETDDDETEDQYDDEDDDEDDDENYSDVLSNRDPTSPQRPHVLVIDPSSLHPFSPLSHGSERPHGGVPSAANSAATLLPTVTTTTATPPPPLAGRFDSATTVAVGRDASLHGYPLPLPPPSPPHDAAAAAAPEGSPRMATITPPPPAATPGSPNSHGGSGASLNGASGVVDRAKSFLTSSSAPRSPPPEHVPQHLWNYWPQDGVTRAEHIFFRNLLLQVAKADRFYARKRTEVRDIMTELAHQAAVMDETERDKAESRRKRRNQRRAAPSLLPDRVLQLWDRLPELLGHGPADRAARGAAGPDRRSRAATASSARSAVSRRGSVSRRKASSSSSDASARPSDGRGGATAPTQRIYGLARSSSSSGGPLLHPRHGASGGAGAGAGPLPRTNVTDGLGLVLHAPPPAPPSPQASLASTATAAEAEPSPVHIPHTYQPQIRPTPLNRILPQTYKKPRDHLRKAFLEFYRLVELITNFQVLNETALTKIMKKYRKRRLSPQMLHRDENQKAEEFLKAVLAHFEIFHTNVKFQAKRCEDLFALHFANGDRRAAMRQLRLPDQNLQRLNDIGVSFMGGIFLGFSIPIIIYILVQVIMNADNTATTKLGILLQIYGGFALPMLLFFLWSLCLHVWRASHINALFILELNVRDHLSPGQFNMIGTFFCAIFSICMCCTIVFYHYESIGQPVIGLDSGAWSAIFAFTVVFIMCMPFPIAYKSSRLWMVRTLGRILTSGLHPVQFRDFFLCDILSSLTYTFSALEIFFCSVWAGFNNIADQCQFHGSWAVPAVTAIPAYFRFIQCVRRYYDERVIWPHLPNAMKYVLSLTTIFLSTNARNNRTPASLALWLVAAFTTAFYAWWWDVYFDWSFVQRDRTAKYGFKWRKQHFPYKWVYWAVPIQNFILRLSFIILISPNQWGLFIGSRTLVWIMALFELWRRVVWCIFRMENEHNTNVGRFRATYEIPLPYRRSTPPVNSAGQSDSEKPDNSDSGSGSGGDDDSGGEHGRAAAAATGRSHPASHLGGARHRHHHHHHHDSSDSNDDHSLGRRPSTGGLGGVGGGGGADDNGYAAARRRGPLSLQGFRSSLDHGHAMAHHRVAATAVLSPSEDLRHDTMRASSPPPPPPHPPSSDPLATSHGISAAFSSSSRATPSVYYSLDCPGVVMSDAGEVHAYQDARHDAGREGLSASPDAAFIRRSITPVQPQPNVAMTALLDALSQAAYAPSRAPSIDYLGHPDAPAPSARHRAAPDDGDAHDDGDPDGDQHRARRGHDAADERHGHDTRDARSDDDDDDAGDEDGFYGSSSQYGSSHALVPPEMERDLERGR